MLVSYEHVSKRYGAVVALRDVSFQLRAGEAVAFCGPNGSGKSTCLRLAIGLIQPTEGRVTVLGGDPSRDWAMKRNIGYAGDSQDLLQELTVEELLYYVGNTRAQSSSMDAEIGWLRMRRRVGCRLRSPVWPISAVHACWLVCWLWGSQGHGDW